MSAAAASAGVRGALTLASAACSGADYNVRINVSALEDKSRGAGLAQEATQLVAQTKQYVDAELYPEPGFGSEVSLESADLLFRFRPADVIERIAPRPLLLVHGQDNRLHSVDESHDLYAHAHEPKRLVLLEGSGHTDWMFDDHPVFRHVIEITHAFIDEALAAQ